jgi:hypothetical protein
MGTHAVAYIFASPLARSFSRFGPSRALFQISPMPSFCLHLLFDHCCSAVQFFLIVLLGVRKESLSKISFLSIGLCKRPNNHQVTYMHVCG